MALDGELIATDASSRVWRLSGKPDITPLDVDNPQLRPRHVITTEGATHTTTQADVELGSVLAQAGQGVSLAGVHYPTLGDAASVPAPHREGRRQPWPSTMT
jgi:hypothetical protein